MKELLLVVATGILAAIVAKVSQRVWDPGRRAIGVSALCAGMVLAVLGGGTATAVQYSTDHYSKLTFYQYLNGVEVGTEMVPTSCTKDDACFYTYRCAPFSETYFLLDLVREETARALPGNQRRVS